MIPQLIVPDMMDYTDAKYMQLVKNFNDMVNHLHQEQKEFLKWKAEQDKEINYMKAAIRNR